MYREITRRLICNHWFILLYVISRPDRWFLCWSAALYSPPFADLFLNKKNRMFCLRHLPPPPLSFPVRRIIMSALGGPPGTSGIENVCLKLNLIFENFIFLRDESIDLSKSLLTFE